MSLFFVAVLRFRSSKKRFLVSIAPASLSDVYLIVFKDKTPFGHHRLLKQRKKSTYSPSKTNSFRVERVTRVGHEKMKEWTIQDYTEKSVDPARAVGFVTHLLNITPCGVSSTSFFFSAFKVRNRGPILIEFSSRFFFFRDS